MARGVAFCPGCGAKVEPEDLHCPACGRRLRIHPGAIAGGAAAVVLAVALSASVVWWALATGASPDAPDASASPESWDSVFAAFGTAISGTDEDRESVRQRLRDKAQPVTAAAAPSPTPEAEAAAQPAASPPSDTPLAADDIPAGDPAARREFAKATQQNFQQNGLDLTVTSQGENDTVISITFSFPARTAVELIVSGPFPRRCKSLGFRQVAFQDSAGAAWTYDIASGQLTNTKS